MHLLAVPSYKVSFVKKAIKYQQSLFPADIAISDTGKLYKRCTITNRVVAEDVSGNRYFILDEYIKDSQQFFLIAYYNKTTKNSYFEMIDAETEASIYKLNLTTIVNIKASLLNDHYLYLVVIDKSNCVNLLCIDLNQRQPRFCQQTRIRGVPSCLLVATVAGIKYLFVGFNFLCVVHVYEMRDSTIEFLYELSVTDAVFSKSYVEQLFIVNDTLFIIASCRAIFMFDILTRSKLELVNKPNLSGAIYYKKEQEWLVLYNFNSKITTWHLSTDRCVHAPNQCILINLSLKRWGTITIQTYQAIDEIKIEISDDEIALKFTGSSTTGTKKNHMRAKKDEILKKIPNQLTTIGLMS